MRLLLKRVFVSILFFYFFTTSAFAYERIISLKPSLTEILFALGVGDKIVGVTSFCDRPLEAKTINIVADYVKPQLEKVVAENPDLIVSSKENSSRQEIDFLIEKGYKVVLFEVENLDELQKTILEVGNLVGKSDSAQKIVQKMQESLKELRETVMASDCGLQPLRALFVLNHRPLIVAGTGNLFQESSRYLGLRNIAGTSALQYPQYPIETVLKEAPEVILDFSMSPHAGERQKQEILNEWAKFDLIPAVKNGRVYVLDASPFRAGPLLAEEWKSLYRLIHKQTETKPVALARLPDSRPRALLADTAPASNLESQPKKDEGCRID